MPDEMVAPVPIEGCSVPLPPTAGMVAVPTITNGVGGTYTGAFFGDP
jgi:hypothetical protein